VANIKPSVTYSLIAPETKRISRNIEVCVRKSLPDEPRLP